MELAWFIAYSTTVIEKVKEMPQSLFYEIIISCKIVDSDWLREIW